MNKSFNCFDILKDTVIFGALWPNYCPCEGRFAFITDKGIKAFSSWHVIPLRIDDFDSILLKPIKVIKTTVLEKELGVIVHMYSNGGQSDVVFSYCCEDKEPSAKTTELIRSEYVYNNDDKHILTLYKDNQ